MRDMGVVLGPADGVGAPSSNSSTREATEDSGVDELNVASRDSD